MGPGASKWAVLEFRPILNHLIVDPNIPGQEEAEKAVKLARSFMDSSLKQAFEVSVRKHEMNLFWQKVLQIGEHDVSKLAGNFGGTLLALKRNDL